MKYADKDIQEMEDFFSTAELPQSIELSEGSKIIDLKAFVFSHLAIIKLRKGVGIFEVFYERLLFVKNKLTSVNISNNAA